MLGKKCKRVVCAMVLFSMVIFSSAGVFAAADATLHNSFGVTYENANLKVFNLGLAGLSQYNSPYPIFRMDKGDEVEFLFGFENKKTGELNVKFVTAEYSSDGRLISANVSDSKAFAADYSTGNIVTGTANAPKCSTVNKSTEAGQNAALTKITLTDDNSYLKFFIWDGSNNLSALAPNVTAQKVYSESFDEGAVWTDEDVTASSDSSIKYGTEGKSAKLVFNETYKSFKKNIKNILIANGAGTYRISAYLYQAETKTYLNMLWGGTNNLSFLASTKQKDIYSGGTDEASYTSDSNNINANGWTQCRGEIIVTEADIENMKAATNNNLFLRVTNKGNTGVTCYIDDVSIIKIGK